MAECYLTSHVEISTTDRVVGGKTIKTGQAIIVSDKKVGGGGEIDICKIAQYVDGLLECVPVTNDMSGLTGTDGETLEGTNLFLSDTAGFIDNNVAAGDFVTISSGNQQGTYRIVQVLTNEAVLVPAVFDIAETGLSWLLIRNQRPPDYSKVLRALPVSANAFLPHLRYFPMFGPGDHHAKTMSTTATTALVDEEADFDDPNRLIPTNGDGYIEILTGADAGFHQIVQVQQTILTVQTSLTATAQDIHYRVRLVSPHATHVMVSEWGTEKVVIPIQDSFEVKIISAVRNLADAQALDVQSEIPKTTRAADLFGAIGEYLGCYRLRIDAADDDGMPLDNRVLIPAKPWRGHDTDGVLFFREAGQQKYTGSALNPVFPIRWLRNMYRLEIAIARDTRQAPTAGQECV